MITALRVIGSFMLRRNDRYYDVGIRKLHRRTKNRIARATRQRQRRFA